MLNPAPTALTGALFVDDEVADALSDRSWLQAMLDFEAALARAEASVGVIPQSAAAAIAALCDASLFDIADIGRRTTLAGNPAIPLVAALTEKVREKDVAAAEFVHYGATSQDVIDSALAERYAAATMLILQRLSQAEGSLAALANRHRETPMVGRTLLQHALPISFGLKCANWLGALQDARANLQPHAISRMQFGGAAGTLSALGEQASSVLIAMKSRAPWHTNRAMIQQHGAALGVLAAAMGKIARDIALLMQTEVAEVFEPSAPGKGGSSTLPHKRNPVQTVAIIAVAMRTPGLVAGLLTAGLQEHERAVGGWHAEWELMRELLLLTGAAALHLQALTDGLEVDPARMRLNLENTNGLIMAERIAFALAPRIGKARAKTFMEAACRRAVAESRHLREILAEAVETDGLDLQRLFDPVTYLGASDAFIDQILERHASTI